MWKLAVLSSLTILLAAPAKDAQMLQAIVGAQQAGGAVPGFISSTCSWCSGYSGTTSPAISTTGATLLIATCGASSSGALAAPSDSSSNSYHATFATAPNYPAGSAYGQFYVAYAPTTSGSMTWTTPGSETCGFSAWKNTLTTSSVVDTTVQASASYATAATAQAGSVTPSQANELLIGMIFFGNISHTWTINDGFTEPTQTQVFSPPVLFAYLVDSSTAAINPTWTIGSSSDTGLTVIAGYLHP